MSVIMSLFIDILLIVSSYWESPIVCSSNQAFPILCDLLTGRGDFLLQCKGQCKYRSFSAVLFKVFPLPFPFAPHIYFFYPQFFTICLSIFCPSFTSYSGFSSRAAFSLSSFLPLSQVKRSLPCFLSNWQMRCMSWLRRCFIRKQVFTILPYHPIVCF